VIDATLAFMLARGLLLGLGAAVPIGPVNVEIARRTLRHGFKGGFLLGLGASSADVIYAILTSLSLRPVLAIQSFRLAAGVIGALLLTFLATMSLRSAWQSRRTDLLNAAPPKVSAHSHYVVGLLMTLFNPFTLMFWFVAVPGLVGSLTDTPGRDLPVLAVGVAAGAISWVVFFTTLLAFASRWRRPWWTVAADAVGGMLLLAFAALTLWKTVT
jgi:L-lysine exporter family protein LysE/ArgO